jgi:hypothetical protein
MRILLVSALSFIAAGANAATEIAFGPVRAQPGESVRLVSLAESRDGTVQVTKDGRTSNGTIRIIRERNMSWTFRAPEADGTLRGMVSVAKIASSSSVTLNGKEEKSEDHSPLNGMMFAMSKPPSGDWKFELDGSIPRQRIQNEIEELTVYLKRRWYPERVVKVGDSWEFDPAWIRMVIQNDLKNAQIIGTMRLRQVRHTAQKDIAVIDVSVRSSGGDFKADGSESKIQLELTGQVAVNLMTMLDESLELKGTVVSSTGTPGNYKTVTLPLSLQVSKSIVGN